MIIKKAEIRYIEDAVTLAMSEYKEECSVCSHLIKEDYSNHLRELITQLFNGRYAMMAIHEDKLVGYIAFWEPFDGFFGNVKGAFSPLGGNAFAGTDRNQLSSLLLQNLLELLVKDEVCSIAVCRYAHDEETAKSFIMNSFGIRCSDAIRDLSIPTNMKDQPGNITFSEFDNSELNYSEYESVRELKKELIKHMSASPVFFPTNINEYDHLLSCSDSRHFVAKDRDKIIGFIAVGYEGENFIGNNKNMLHICGAYFMNDYRGTGIPAGLIDYLIKKIKSEGIEYLGVDFETINPNALRFWGKYFSSYTYSYVRRIDERIIGYEKYLKDL